jgi:hypothetical protein
LLKHLSDPLGTLHIKIGIAQSDCRVGVAVRYLIPPMNYRIH